MKSISSNIARVTVSQQENCLPFLSLSAFMFHLNTHGMGATEREHTQARIVHYLTGRIKETFKEDFPLVERLLPALIERYSLKELIIIIRLEIDRLKNSNRSRPGEPHAPEVPPLA